MATGILGNGTKLPTEWNGDMFQLFKGGNKYDLSTSVLGSLSVYQIFRNCQCLYDFQFGLIIWVLWPFGFIITINNTRRVVIYSNAEI